MAAQDGSRLEPLDEDTADLGSMLGEPRPETASLEEGEDSPRDTPLAVDEYGITGAEEARREPLRQRIARETRELSPGRRAVDPDRLGEHAFSGRLVNDNGVRVARDDTGGFSAEEGAVHLEPGPAGGPARKPTQAARIELLEAQVAVLLTMARIQTEALESLATALESLPTEEPGQAAVRVGAGARKAHQLLLAIRGGAG